MEDIKLVVADIDGTLVNEARECTPLCQYVLNQLHEKGILFGLASGRPADELNYLHNKWGIQHSFDFAIGMNGGQIFDNLANTYNSYYLLNQETIRKIIETYLPLKYARPVIYLGDKIASDRMDERLQGTGRRAGKDLIIFDSYEQFWAQENAKVMYRLPEDKMDEMIAYCTNHPIDGVTFFKTQPTMLEFCDPRINKAVALAQFCQRHNISSKQVMAFGDTSNDNEMLAWAKNGICLHNGSQDSKYIASDITPLTNSEDGFAHYLLQTVLK